MEAGQAVMTKAIVRCDELCDSRRKAINGSDSWMDAFLAAVRVTEADGREETRRVETSGGGGREWVKAADSDRNLQQSTEWPVATTHH